MDDTKSIKILALFGKSASGKDTIQNLLLKNYPDTFHKIISCTTRPKRDYEIEGDDYHFISRAEFLDRMMNEEFIEALEFNGWFCGALISALDPDKVNIGIFTPEGIESLRLTASSYNLEVLPIYIMCDEKIRMLRALNREKHPDLGEIVRRYTTDEEDFRDIDFGYISIDNDKNGIIEGDMVKTIYNLSLVMSD